MAIDFSKMTPDQMAMAEKVMTEATNQGVDPNFALAQAYQESGFNHYKVDPKTGEKAVLTSPQKAYGVMQVTQDTADTHKLGDITDPDTNIKAGIGLMKTYLDKYKSPEAALIAYHQGPGVADAYMSKNRDPSVVGPHGLDYVVNIGSHYDLDKNTGYLPQQKAEETDYKPVAQQLLDQGYHSTDDSQKPDPHSIAPIDTMTAAGIGAAANVLGVMPTSPKIPAKVDLSALQEAYAKAGDKADLAWHRYEDAMANPGGAEGSKTIAQLEAEFKASQAGLTKAQNDLIEAGKNYKMSQIPAEVTEVTKAAPKVNLASATPTSAVGETSSLIPTEQQFTGGMQGNIKPSGATGRANQTTYQARTQNIANAAQAQEEAVNELAKKGIVKPLTHPESPIGKFGAMGSTPSGVLVEPNLAGEVQNKEELAKKVEQTKLAQAKINQQAEIDRLKAAKDNAKALAADAKRELDKAVAHRTGNIATASRKAQEAADAHTIAEQALKRAQNVPSGLDRTLQVVGNKTAMLGPVARAGLGALGGLGVGMSVNEAIKRYKEGDYSGMVLPVLEATTGAMSMVPPVGPLAAVRGLGTLGGLGLAGYEIGKAMK